LEADFDYSKDEQFRVILHSTGLVRWLPGGIFKAGCPLDLTYFPFDEQKCTFIFASWTYHWAALRLHALHENMQISKVTYGSQWKIKTVSMHVEDEFFEPGMNEARFSLLHIEMASERMAGFYVIHIMVPATVISSLSLLAFLLPCESGEKVSLGITILLAFSVFQLVVADQLPTNTISIPILGEYMLRYSRILKLCLRVSH
jgi:hypothetical protein